MMKQGSNHSRKALKFNVCEKQTTGQMIQKMFAEQLGQMEEERGKPVNTAEEERISMEDMKEERPADTKPNHDRETGREWPRR